MYLKVLKDEGYIRDYKNVDVREGIRKIKIELKYHEGIPVIKKSKEFQNQEFVFILKLKNFLNHMEVLVFL